MALENGWKTRARCHVLARPERRRLAMLIFAGPCLLSLVRFIFLPCCFFGSCRTFWRSIGCIVTNIGAVVL